MMTPKECTPGKRVRIIPDAFLAGKEATGIIIRNDHHSGVKYPIIVRVDVYKTQNMDPVSGVSYFDPHELVEEK